jgi:putative colanic acid biosynthesis acetyltransferase WcaF
MESNDSPASVQREEDRPAGEPLALSEGERWPYPRHEYVLRLLWAILWQTIWQVCWRRIPSLRTMILRLVGTKIRTIVDIAGSARVTRPWDMTVGTGCSIGPRVHLYNLGGLEIGEQVVISQDAFLCGGTHDYTDPRFPLLRKKIVIGDYVWIAAGAFIGPGVTIGEGAVVGARAVVMKDVPPWTVVAGNPAVVVKQRVIKK